MEEQLISLNTLPWLDQDVGNSATVRRIYSGTPFIPNDTCPGRIFIDSPKTSQDESCYQRRDQYPRSPIYPRGGNVQKIIACGSRVRGFYALVLAAADWGARQIRFR